MRKVLKNRFLYFLIFFSATVIAAKYYNSGRTEKILETERVSADSYVHQTSTVRTPDKSKADSIAEYAIAQIGVPYLAAGKNLNGFDCSGFTWFVFKKFGIELPASSIMQSEIGDEIEIEDLRKADLVLFKSPTEGRNQIGHVGIVISDPGEKVLFVHSSTGRGVIIDSLNRPNYKRRYMGARRVL